MDLRPRGSDTAQINRSPVTGYRSLTDRPRAQCRIFPKLQNNLQGSKIFRLGTSVCLRHRVSRPLEFTRGLECPMVIPESVVSEITLLQIKPVIVPTLPRDQSSLIKRHDSSSLTCGSCDSPEAPIRSMRFCLIVSITDPAEYNRRVASLPIGSSPC